ncbi:2'-5' RNA ligase family protein [Bacillus sp. Marseille-Q1617]|uniref:2'-5' RNA ligase family protein n=1 Tax=Bacillus sp. Marseille-Q1617 TaxID=2736887 RepID=UPI00158E98B4|nr:2'-5' RNA ligase family protein [Bacillus sp. Marseille-Q1617]
MFWVTAQFDEETENLIKTIWKELRDHSISYYIDEVQDGRPHLTLASYKELDKENYIKQMDIFYDDKKCFDITFNHIGSFLNYNTLFLSPTATKELLDFHTHHHKHFKTFSTEANELYEPGQWIPHCTLANKLEADQLSKAFHYCVDRIGLTKGRIEEVGLIELAKQDGDTMHAPLIYSKKLK